MYVPSLRNGLAALAALGGFATAANAQLPQPLPVVPIPVLPAVPGAPQVIKWQGGFLVMNGPEIIVRNTTPGGNSTNVVTNSGNGFGNKIVVSGGPGGVTIVKNARNGFGNQLITDPNDVLVDVDAIIANALGQAGVKPIFPGVPQVPVVPVMPPVVNPAPAAPQPAPPAVIPANPAPAPAPMDPNAAGAATPSYKGKASPFWTKKAFSDAYDCNLYWCPTTKLWFRYIGEDDTYRPVPTQPAAPIDEK